jgi:hypothetical protein
MLGCTRSTRKYVQFCREDNVKMGGLLHKKDRVESEYIKENVEAEPTLEKIVNLP